MFIAHLNKNLQAKGQGGLVCSLTEAMFKNVLVSKINGLLEGENVKKLVATETLGRTKDVDKNGHHVYVLSDKVISFSFLFFIPRGQFLKDHSRDILIQ